VILELSIDKGKGRNKEKKSRMCHSYPVGLDGLLVGADKEVDTAKVNHANPDPS
jgi:hypothetical protein